MNSSVSVKPIDPERKVKQNNVLNVHIKDKNELYAAYMPFIKQGCLFIYTNKTYEMGEELFLLLQLCDEMKKFPITGKVIWRTPLGAQRNLTPGVGIQFCADEAASVQKKIVTLLAGSAGSDRPTDTM